MSDIPLIAPMVSEEHMSKRSHPFTPSSLPRKKKATALSTTDRRSFPVVGIGASAGGLEPLEEFFRRMPIPNGMAFVIVQHLDPTHEGIMPELLQRATSMKVVQVRNRTSVEPNHVYVIPPNKDMTILKGVLHLMPPAEPRGLRLPIDNFFHSLATDCEDRSIAVILSGMGSDGTLGARAIKEHAGLVLVQEPGSAKFGAMPQSAMDAGLADVVAPVTELPDRILDHLRHEPLVPHAKGSSNEKVVGSLDQAVEVLRDHTGHDFSLYKRNTLHRRMERRMGLHHIDKIPRYVRYLQDNPQERDLLFKELLIGVTSFFRDPLAWQELSQSALPTLFSNRSPGHRLRAWVPGSSTGEEAYSLAMVFREAVERLKGKEHFTLQIFATDLDRDAIDRARQGLFPESISADVSPARLARFFTKENRGFRVKKEIRETIIFAPQNLVMDPPFTKLDILSCRNLLIYLTAEVQKKLMPLFHYSLSPGGLLFLGSAETTGAGGHLFSALPGKSRIYRRVESGLRPSGIDFPSSFGNSSSTGASPRPVNQIPPSLQAAADRLILDTCAPAAVLVNDKGDILYVSGRTGKYLEPAAGKANWNMFAMLRDGLRFEVSTAFQKAIRNSEKLVVRDLQVETLGGESQHLNITLEQLQAPGALQGLILIVFHDLPSPQTKVVRRSLKSSSRSEREMALEEEVLKIRAESRNIHQEMQTSQEEFRSANEELQSTNEELQSTNEELTTSKEVQSLNEELQTLNTELQSKVDELSRASNDMKNLLDSTDIATLFLDNSLHVRRFTPQATRIIKLIPGDAGRPITDLTTDLEYPDLAIDARKVLKTLASIEKPIRARRGRWFSVRIMPYRTLDDRIDGVVITFADITASKELEARLRGSFAGKDRQSRALPVSRKARGKPPSPTL